MTRPQKITFAEMRDQGVRGVLIYCADYHCSHSMAISGDAWPDEVRLSDIEDRFICTACSKRGGRGARLQRAQAAEQETLGEISLSQMI